MPTFKYIILTCDRYLKTRASGIELGWGRGKDVTFLSNFHICRQIVWWDFIPQSYPNLYKRYINYIQAYELADADWVVFGDDDTWFNTKNLERKLESFNFDPGEKACFGKIGTLKPDGLDDKGNWMGFPYDSLVGEDTSLPLNYPSGGAGFALNQGAYKAVREYLQNSKNPEGANNTDVAMGFWLRQAGVPLFHSNLLHSNNPDKLGHSGDDLKYALSYHYVTNQKELDARIHRDS